jgi:hypothetical protein
MRKCLLITIGVLLLSDRVLRIRLECLGKLWRTDRQHGLEPACLPHYRLVTHQGFIIPVLNYVMIVAFCQKLNEFGLMKTWFTANSSELELVSRNVQRNVGLRFCELIVVLWHALY